MKLTKYEHACFVIEKDGSSLVVDPGGWSRDFVMPENVTVIVITHEHPDHFDAEKLRDTIANNPSAVIYAHASITEQLPDLPTRNVSVNESIQAASFSLAFVGGQHATIAPQFPAIANLGVIIDEKLYYPGDSFFVPEDQIHVLALPAAAPWCKISEVMAFVNAVTPRIAFPTHDAILSTDGKQLIDTLLTPVVAQAGGTYQRLSEPLEI